LSTSTRGLAQVNTSAVGNISPSKGTVAVWAKWPMQPNHSVAAFQWGASAPNFIMVHRSNNNRANAIVGGNSNINGSSVTPRLIPDDTWTFLSLEYEAGTAYLYKDNVLIATTAYTNPPTTASGTLSLGGTLSYSEEVYVRAAATFDRRLTDTERTALFTAKEWTEANLFHEKMPFLVDNMNEIPIGYGTASTNWVSGTTIVETFDQVPDDVLYLFNRLAVTEDEYATPNQELALSPI
jgi:hypothetical protein